MEIKVNDYVRTKRGDINKVIGIREELRDGKRVYSHKAYYLDSRKGSLTEAFIVKHSNNIIDLIECGDYVNGSKVIDIAQSKTKAIYVEQITTGALVPIINKNIKSILTKQQFSSLEYIINDKYKCTNKKVELNYVGINTKFQGYRHLLECKSFEESDLYKSTMELLDKI